MIDTGATISAISSKFTHGCSIRKEKSIPIKVGNGQLLFSQGTTDVEVNLGQHKFSQQVMVLDTKAFEEVLGMDFLHSSPMINGILFRPARLVVNNEEILLREEVGENVNRLLRLFKTESYQLIPQVRNQALNDLGIKNKQVKVDLFASPQSNSEDLFCTKKNSAGNTIGVKCLKARTMTYGQTPIYQDRACIDKSCPR